MSKSSSGALSRILVETKLQILGYLPLPDILSLRLASKYWNKLICYNEHTIAAHHLSQGFIPKVVLELYPAPQKPDLNHIAALVPFRHGLSNCLPYLQHKR